MVCAQYLSMSCKSNKPIRMRKYLILSHIIVSIAVCSIYFPILTKALLLFEIFDFGSYSQLDFATLRLYKLLLRYVNKLL